MAKSLVIAFASLKHPVLQALGTASYSLYLIHVGTGGKFVNLGGRFVEETAQSIVLIAVALAVSALLACALYVLVEKPTQRWFSRISYWAPVAS